MPQPKNTLDKILRVINSWETLTPEKSFGGMTLAQAKTTVQPSLDTREELRVLESKAQAKQIERDDADVVSLRTVQRIIDGVIGDPEEGRESDLYVAFGFQRPSQRKSGLTRKKKSGGGTNGGQ
jgi:hypothetical protein